MELDQKVALVLGGIKGIGKGIALALARRGVKVALPFFDWEEHLPALQQDLAAVSADHLVLRTDLRDADSVATLVEQTVGRWGRLDILINNIERGGWPVVHGAYVREQWDLELATTLGAKQWVFQAALPHLQASNAGAVINISSIAALVGRSGPASLVFNDGYAAANRGISLLTETWARLGAPRVRVNEIMLGLVDSRHGPGTWGWGLLDQQQQRALLDHTLLKRIGSIDDVIKAVLYIVEADFMTGSVLRLDGGYCLGGDIVAPMPAGVV